MSRVRAFAAIVVSVLCFGCAATLERAVAIAVGEVANRKLPLPANYTVRVQEGFSAMEFAPSYKIWCVDLGAPGQTQPLYSVWVDQRNGTIDSFTDYRREKFSPVDM